MSEIKLRPYQSELRKNINQSIRDGNKRIIAVLPTGGGKTFTFATMVKTAWERGRRILILTDRIELMTQAGGALSTLGLEPIRIEAGKTPYLGAKLYTAMVETLKRRVSKRPDYVHWLGTVDIIIVDECHKRSFTSLFANFSVTSRVIGFTATPERIGKKDQLGETYEDLIVGVEISELIEDGYLSKPNYYGVKSDLKGVRSTRGDYDQTQVAKRFSETKLYKGVVENWKKQTPNTKTLVFSSSIANSLELVDEFAQNGVDVKHLDSNMGKLERESTLRWFSRTPLAVLCNVGILTTGFDEPSIETIVLYRATKSLPLYLQMCGRGSRTTVDKTTFNILDFGNNILTHGFWHETRKWDIGIKTFSEKKLRESVLKNCPKCEAFISARSVVCEHCGFEDIKEKKEQEFAELQLLNPKELRAKADTATLQSKAEMAKKELIKSFWVLHNLRTIEDVEKFISLMGYSPYWMEHNHTRFWWSDAYKKKRDNGKMLVKWD